MTKTCNVAVERVLFASTRSLDFDRSYSARDMEIVSAAGAFELIVRVAEREMVFKRAVMLALVAAETAVVLMVKFAVADSSAAFLASSSRRRMLFTFCDRFAAQPRTGR